MPEIAPAGYRPSLVSWNLTKQCNLRCPHCYLDAGAKAGNELSREECFALLGELHALGTEMVILTGGEPLLRRDIFDISREASRLGMWVVMGTNGVLVNDRVARTMTECGVRGVAISIDSTDPGKHDSFRGGPNAWKHSVRALETCREHGLQVLVQATVTPMNFDEIPELIEFARRKGAWSFNLYFLVQTGRGRGMSELSPRQTAEMLGRLAEAQARCRPMLLRAKCAPQYKQISYAGGWSGLESGGCMAGTEYVRITPEGDVTPCPFMDLAAGNVRDLGFTRIWREAPILTELRDLERLRGRCGRCEFKALCGGCRCRAYAVSGNPLEEDPACTYEPTGRPLPTPELSWTREAAERLDRIPIAFIREKVRTGMEAYARSRSVGLVTSEMMTEALSQEGRFGTFRTPPSILTRGKGA